MAAVVVTGVGILAAGCGDNGESSSGSPAAKEVVITCATCTGDPSNAFLTLHSKVVDEFNKKFAGRYRVERINSQSAKGGPERLQYYQRQALANDLADVFTVNPGEVAKLRATGKIVDFKSILDANPDWKATFYPDAFATNEGEDGQIWAVPQTRDAIGVFYNKTLLNDAGVTEFPRSWDEFAGACDKIKVTGKACLAMDGDWTTLLLWADLIGTQPEGKPFLESGIAEGNYASDPAVVKATETLKEWHVKGYTNEDSLAGDFNNAANAFLRSEAAFIPNGPWFVPLNLKAKGTPKGLYKQVGYEPSPGWTPDQRGVIVIAGEGSWASGSTDADKKAAVTEFLKFATTREEGIAQVKAAGAYPAVDLKLTDDEVKTLEPLGAALVKESSDVPLHYPHAYFRAPAGFGSAWKNLWPAYVKGELDTQEFLNRLGSDATSPTG